MARVRFSISPAIWITFDDSTNRITQVEIDADQRYSLSFARQGREWGPFTVEQGYQSFNVSPGANKRYEDVQVIRMEPIP